MQVLIGVADKPLSPFDCGFIPPSLTFMTWCHREEVQVLGLTVLVDARGTTPLPIIFSALRSLHVSRSQKQMCV